MQKVSFSDAVCIVLVIIEIFHQCQNTEGLLWIDEPGAFTYGPQGSNISMRWHYKVESKETFLHSEIRFESRSLDLASRHTGENSYVAMELTGDTKVPFSVVGKTNVTLTVYNAEFSYVGSYCCEVTVRINNLKPRVETCTSLYVYELPRITYYTPDQSCKQGDQVKLQCNATGYPHPQFKWTRRDASYKITANSSLTSLSINGKRSSGQYCCHVTNRFGNESKCTSVLVTEYHPITTTLSSETTYIIKDKMFQLTCKADAQPPPYYIFLQNNKQIFNSSDGIYSSDNITGDKAINISCTPWNKYGKGPRKSIILPVYDPPKITSDLRTRYNMTDKNINITCRATGIPIPNITLIDGKSGKVVSTKGYYEVPYEKCDNVTLTFYCQASNMVGSVSSTEIQVQGYGYIDPSCIPRTTLGPTKPMYVIPRFTSDMATTYNMTDGDITIKCSATGIPKPNITWFEADTREIVSTNENYKVPYVEDSNKTLNFYCRASNILGSINSPEIQVQVMTSKGYSVELVKFCKVTSKGMNYKIAIIIAVSVAVFLLLLFVILVLIRFWKLKNKQNAEIEESPYGEPIDSIPITVAGKLERVLPVNEEYATIEEVGFKKGKEELIKSDEEQPASDEKPLQKQSEEPIYAVVKK